MPDEATGALEITEVDSHGEVQALWVMNTSRNYVLLIAGEEVVVAKQDRIINTTILITPGTSTNIPVSCVQRDRWSWESRHFGTEKRLSPARLRKRTSSSVTSFARHGDDTFVSDQHGIWEEISFCFHETGISSPTSEMGAIYREKRKNLTDYEHAFKPVDRQVGVVFVVNGKVAGLDSFINYGVLKKLFPKIVQSYAFEALLFQPVANAGHVKRTEVNDFMKISPKLERLRLIPSGWDMKSGLNLPVSRDTPWLRTNRFIICQLLITVTLRIFQVSRTSGWTEGGKQMIQRNAHGHLRHISSVKEG